jgi:hypothetical protein
MANFCMPMYFKIGPRAHNFTLTYVRSIKDGNQTFSIDEDLEIKTKMSYKLVPSF